MQVLRALLSAGAPDAWRLRRCGFRRRISVLHGMQVRCTGLPPTQAAGRVLLRPRKACTGYIAACVAGAASCRSVAGHATVSDVLAEFHCVVEVRR